MKLIVAFLMLFSIQAFALELPERPNSVDKSVEFTWNIPTERENGEALSVEEIGGYELYVSKDGGETITHLIEQGDATSFGLQDLDVGSYEATIRTFDTNGLYSRPADLLTFEVEDVSAPNPPSFFEVVLEFLSALFGRITAFFA